MATTASWGYTNGTTQIESTLKLPVIEAEDYAEVMRESSTNRKTTAQYRNLTTPANQGEYVQLRAERRDKISSSYPLAYPPETKQGYMFSIKLENTLRKNYDDGTMSDNPAGIIITCYATDGTFCEGGLNSGKAWADYLQRELGYLYKGVYDQSDSKITIDTSTQPVFDKLMHTVAELNTNITTQA
jgi:hypothetical protein